MMSQSAFAARAVLLGTRLQPGAVKLRPQAKSWAITHGADDAMAVVRPPPSCNQLLRLGAVAAMRAMAVVLGDAFIAG